MSIPSREAEGDKTAPKAVIGRLSLYLRQLEQFQRQGFSTVSSNQLGEPLSIKNAQVRKDLAFFGQFGHPGIGYRIEDLIDSLRRVIGIDREWPLALIGLGNIGRALLKYRGFRTRGFQIAALFDSDPRKVGQKYDDLVIEPLDSLRKTLAFKKISLAILSVPAEPAQHVADQLVACGIQGILNFAPVTLNVPPGISVMAVDLSVQLENLAYKVLRSREREIFNSDPSASSSSRIRIQPLQ